jgi:ribosomal protein L13E
MSARIGNGISTYEQGKISAANEVAKKIGITVEMTAKEAADRMFEALTQKTE